jgi:hypothetical protein
LGIKNEKGTPENRRALSQKRALRVVLRAELVAGEAADDHVLAGLGDGLGEDLLDGSSPGCLT